MFEIGITRNRYFCKNEKKNGKNKRIVIYQKSRAC